MTQSIDKTLITRAIISKIQDETKPLKIQAKHVLGFDSPNKISLKGQDEGFVPDIAVIYEKKTIVYEIELNKTMPVDKWHLLSLFARKHNGSLYLVVPEYLKNPIKKEISENEINAGVIVFQT